MIYFNRGDAVLVDLGQTAKVRPCIVVSIPNADSQRNMSVVVPMTSILRQGECEIPFPKPPWLDKPSAINLLGITGVDNARIIRRLAPMPDELMTEISQGLNRLLGLGHSVE